MPSCGKKKTEIIFCTMLIALASAQRGCRYKAALILEIFTVAAILAPDHRPSESRNPWSQHHAVLGMAGWAMGHAAQPAACGMSHRHSVSWICSDLTLKIKPPVLPSPEMFAFNSGQCVARHKHVFQLEGRPSAPLRNVEMVFPPLRAIVFC